VQHLLHRFVYLSDFPFAPSQSASIVSIVSISDSIPDAISKKENVLLLETFIPPDFLETSTLFYSIHHKTQFRISNFFKFEFRTNAKIRQYRFHLQVPFFFLERERERRLQKTTKGKTLIVYKKLSQNIKCIVYYEESLICIFFFQRLYLYSGPWEDYQESAFCSREMLGLFLIKNGC